MVDLIKSLGLVQTTSLSRPPLQVARPALPSSNMLNRPEGPRPIPMGLTDIEISFENSVARLLPDFGAILQPGGSTTPPPATDAAEGTEPSGQRNLNFIFQTPEQNASDTMALYDTDGSGDISATEWQTYQSNLGATGSTEQQSVSSEAYARFDGNGDGTVTSDELTAQLAATQPNIPSLGANAAAAIAKMNANDEVVEGSTDAGTGTADPVDSGEVDTAIDVEGETQAPEEPDASAGGESRVTQLTQAIAQTPDQNAADALAFYGATETGGVSLEAFLEAQKSNGLITTPEQEAVATQAYNNLNSNGDDPLTASELVAGPQPPAISLSAASMAQANASETGATTTTAA